MFRFHQKLFFGEIKIPYAKNICFEENGAAVVDLALKTGQAEADIDNLEQTTDEHAEKLESLEQKTKWNDETLDRAFDRICTMESKVEELESRIAVLEVENADLKAQAGTKEPPSEGEGDGTTLTKPPDTSGSKETKPEPPKRKFSLLW